MFAQCKALEGRWGTEKDFHVSCILSNHLPALSLSFYGQHPESKKGEHSISIIFIQTPDDPENSTILFLL